MGTLMKLLIALGLDTGPFDKDSADAEKKATSSAQRIAGAFTEVGAKMQSVGAGMTVGLTLPIVAAGIAGVNAASDLNETMSKVGVVFGDNADRVLEFGKSAAVGMGMSSNAALTAAGTYGNLFVSMGMASDASADMSMGLVKLASDVASFNNMDPGDVMAKFQAGLTGESEPLKALGVNINEATIKAKAMELGLMDTTGELSAASKAQAVYAMILEQTKPAQGDFARTSGGLANQLRTLQGQFQDLSAKLGAILLPIVIQVVTALNKIVAGFINLPGPIQTGIVVLLGIVAAAGPIIAAIGTIVTTVGSLMTLFAAGGPLMTAITTITTVGLPMLTTAFTTFTSTAIPAITAAFGTLVSTVFPGLTAAATTFATTTVPTMLASLGSLALAALPIIALVAAFALLGVTIMVFGQDALNTLTMIGAIIGALVSQWPRLVSEAVTSMFGGIKTGWDSLSGWIQGVIKGVAGFFEGVIAPVLTGIRDFMVKLQEVFNWVADAINNVAAAMAAAASGLSGALSAGAGMGNASPSSPIAGSATVAGMESVVSGGGRGAVYNQQTYNIYSAEQPGEIGNALSIAAFLGGAA